MTAQRAHALFDEKKRAHATHVTTLWGRFNSVPGRYAQHYPPFHGIQYGEMEPASGHCARQSLIDSDCGGWNKRVRKLPTLADCEKRAGILPCTISPSGARYDAATNALTITLYARHYDLQYSATFKSFDDYLANAVSERGLKASDLTRELNYVKSVLGKHLHAFTAGRDMQSVAIHYLKDNAPHNLSPQAGSANIIPTTGVSK